MFSDIIEQKESTLLQPPGSEQPVFQREQLSYKAHLDRYRLGERSFNRQYAHLYATRLMQMRDILVNRAKQKWGKSCWLL